MLEIVQSLPLHLVLPCTYLLLPLLAQQIYTNLVISYLFFNY